MVLGTSTFSSEGIYTDTYKYNWGGTTGTDTVTYPYSVTPNLDGSWNLAVTTAGGTVTNRVIISDDKVYMLDGARTLGSQMIFIAIKRETKTYTNADLNSSVFAIGYEYDSLKSFWPGYYTAKSAIRYFDGMDNCPFTITFNSDGAIMTRNYDDTYTLSSDGALVMSNGRTGFIGKGLADIFLSGCCLQLVNRTRHEKRR